jgi:hypothetical protein
MRGILCEREQQSGWWVGGWWVGGVFLEGHVLFNFLVGEEGGHQRNGWSIDEGRRPEKKGSARRHWGGYPPGTGCRPPGPSFWGFFLVF